MSGAPAGNAPATVTISVQMIPEDAERLWEMALGWSDMTRPRQLEVAEYFEALAPLAADADPRATWRRAYWVGESYSELLLLRSYISALGHDYEVFWDPTPCSDMGERGTFRGYVILTDWVNELES